MQCKEFDETNLAGLALKHGIAVLAESRGLLGESTCCTGIGGLKLLLAIRHLHRIRTCYETEKNGESQATDSSSTNSLRKVQNAKIFTRRVTNFPVEKTCVRMFFAPLTF